MININNESPAKDFQHPPPTKQFVEQLMVLADNMAAAAVSFTSHGYDTFIHTRQQLIDKLNELK